MRLSLVLVVIIICSACGPSSDQMIEQVVSLEDSLKAVTRRDSAYRPLSERLIAARVAFADAYPQDSLAPVYLMSAADLSRGMEQPQAAVDLWNRVVENYPDFPRTPEALFLIGVTYDKFLNDQEKALETYERFLETYPSHGFSEDVEMMKSVINPPVAQ